MDSEKGKVLDDEDEEDEVLIVMRTWGRGPWTNLQSLGVLSILSEVDATGCFQERTLQVFIYIFKRILVCFGK